MPKLTHNSHPLIVVVPELYRRTGGVQVFSRNFVRAVDAITGSRVEVISMNDRAEDFPAEFCEGRTVRTCGGLPSRCRAFGLAAILLRQRRGTRFLCTHPGPSRWLGYLSRLMGTAYLVVAHGVDVWEVRKRSLRNGLKRAARILPVSRFTRDRLVQQLGEDLPKLVVFPNQVDAETFFPAAPGINWRERLSISIEAPVVLTVSRLDRTEERKGYDLVLEVIDALRAESPELTWILAGKGEDRARIRNRAAELGIADACRFPGFIEDGELPDLYRSADAFVLPSRKEGFGIVFLEAAACGIPVVAGNLDGSVDALDEGRLGQLVNPESLEEIEEALRKILRKAADLPFQGESIALHNAVKQQFGRDAFEKRLQEVLEGLSWI